MRAVIMAGGQGSRLRPLTCSVPKPMMRLFGRPVVEYILDLLGGNGFDSAVMTLGYLPQEISSHFESGKYAGISLSFSSEEKPMGTAGSVKLALKGYNDTFAVISGDAVCDFEIDKIVKYHKATGAKVTIVGYEVEDPREYGLVSKSDDGRILGFLEKPSWGQAVTNLANTGIYIIEPDVLDMIPDSQPFDFAKDLFPEMLRKGMPLFCYNAEGYWCDIGDSKAYLKCHADLLGGKSVIDLKRVTRGTLVFEKDELDGEYTLEPPVYIGQQVDIGKGAVIGPFSIIDDECSVGENAKIKSSLMLRGSCAGASASMNEAILADGATLKRGASMFEGSVLGGGSCAGVGCVLKSDVLVWPGKNIENYTIVNGNVKYGSCSRNIFEDDGVGGDLGIELTPETCAAIGAGIGSVKSCKKAGIAYDGSPGAKAMMLAVISGMMASGSRVWTFGDCFEAQLSFFTSFCGLGIGVFVSGSNETQIKVCGEGGLSIPRFLEREIEARVSRSEFNRCPGETCKDVADMSSIGMMYSRELLRQAPYDLKGLSARAISSNSKITRLMNDSLERLGCDSGDAMTLKINNSGTKLNIISEELGTVGYEKLLTVCCYNELKNGRDIALPFDAPLILDSLAQLCSRKAYRYLSSPSDSSDSAARSLAAKQVWVRDGLFLGIRLLSIMKEREMTLRQLLEELPDFYTAKKTFSIQFSPSKLAQIIGEDECTQNSSREGILLKKENGRLLITPSRSGKRLNVIAEADKMEIAAELCDSVEQLLKGRDSAEK